MVVAGCGGPADERVLRRGNGIDPGTLDPALAQDEHAFNVLADLYEGLLAHAADGSLVPGVAERWTVSDDGLTYTFYLRDDARWSNGRAVTAEHFELAFERVMNPETAAPLSSLLDTVEAMHVRDERELAITLSQPTPYFLSILAMAIAAPAWPGAQPGEVTNGTYALDYWRPGEVLRVSRNTHHRDADVVAFDAVEYYPIADPSFEYTRYAAGELDITMTVPPARFASLRENRGHEMRVAPRLAVYYLALDLTEPPLDDPVIREALSRAIDRDTLVDILGRGEMPAYGFVPDGIEGYSPSRYKWQGNPDPIDSALSLTLMYDAGGVHENIAVAVASMWQERLGIEVQLEKREWKYFLDSRAIRADWDVMRFAWTGDYTHPMTFLDLFVSGGAMNLPGYSSAEFDRLLADGDYAAAEARMLADFPVIPLYFYVSKHLVNPGIKGFEANPLDLHPSRFLSR